MKKTEITMDEWQEAERQLSISRSDPKPQRSITAEEYGKKTGRSTARARQVLNVMIKAGIARRSRWRSPDGIFYVYFLNGK